VAKPIAHLVGDRLAGRRLKAEQQLSEAASTSHAYDYNSSGEAGKVWPEMTDIGYDGKGDRSPLYAGRTVRRGIEMMTSECDKPIENPYAPPTSELHDTAVLKVTGRITVIPPDDLESEQDRARVAMWIFATLLVVFIAFLLSLMPLSVGSL